MLRPKDILNVMAMEKAVAECGCSTRNHGDPPPRCHVEGSSEHPHELLSRVVHPTRGEGTVVGLFRQTKGTRRWVCWVSFGKGESHAIDAEQLRATQHKGDPR